MNYVEIVCSLLLIGASGYGLYALDPSANPYALSIAAFCLIHGMLSLVRAVDSGEENECGRAYLVSAGIVDILPLPLANVEFYMKDSQNQLAVIHALTLILLIYDMLGSLSDEWDQNTETVKDLAIVCNIGSGVYFGATKENYFHVGIAATTLVARYAPPVVKSISPEVAPHIGHLGRAAIVGLLTYNLTQK